MARYTNEFDIVEKVIQKVGKRLVIGTPLGAGKANHILNAFYQKAKEDPTIDLSICTALTLQRPTGNSDLEAKFLGPFQERIFGNYPDLDYEIARVNNDLPDNIKVIEFYFPPGKMLNNPTAQQNYISSNYTHVVRDMLDRGINVLTQIVAAKTTNGQPCFSLSCNPDLSVDMADALEGCGYPYAMIAEVNQNLPFMLGDAVVAESRFDFIMDDPDRYYTVFGPPKMSVSDADYMIGLYCSTLVKDDGELQIGIGSLGDSTVYNMLIRHEENDVYQNLLKDLKVVSKFGSTIEKYGSTLPFEIGLFGATEMLVDGFMHLFNAGIIKKKVYNHIGLQRLINEGLVEEQFNDSILETLVKYRIIHDTIDQEDFDFLQYWGIFKSNIQFENGVLILSDGDTVAPKISQPECLAEMKAKCLGTSLQNGEVLQGGFFLGPQKFYTWLKNLPDETLRLINMKSVQKINQLYGHETLNRLHRKNARFINSCMMCTLSGAAVSDGLEDGRVVSGVGGQYNFVAMAQELPDGNSVLNLRSTRNSKGKVVSNIIPNYGHITIPRHLRDIVVTEYGIAFLRGKTDAEVIKALLNVTDSRFQDELMHWAKKVGKLEKEYKIPETYRNNTPDQYIPILKKYKEKGYFKPFPFGTDLTEDEIKIGRALKAIKADLGRKLELIKDIIKGLPLQPQPQDIPLLQRMDLEHPKNAKEHIYQKLLLEKFREFGY